MTLTCHCLIGIPGSGKTTLANQWIDQASSLIMICPDDIRDQLYGDPVIQGDWDAVRDEIQRQFAQAIAQEQSIIYDATNVKRVWRQDVIKTRPNLDWIAWQMLTPLKVCLERNQTRDRQVPMDVVIDYAQILHQEPPNTSEGFRSVHDVPMTDQYQVDWEKMRSLLSY